MFLPFCLQSNIGKPKKINIKYAKIHMKWELEITRNQYIIIIHSLDIIYTEILIYYVSDIKTQFRQKIGICDKSKIFCSLSYANIIFVNVLSMSINAGIIICPSCPSIIHNDSMFGCIEQCIRIAIRFFCEKINKPWG